MMFKFFLIFPVIALLTAIVSGQERNFGIEISLEENVIAGEMEKIPAAVKITNLAPEVLKTEGLDPLNLYFSKCWGDGVCLARKDVYQAVFKLPAKKLRENESIEFEVNLADLYWTDRLEITVDLAPPKNFAEIPAENIYFFADIKLFQGYKDYKGVDKKVPVYKSFMSNTITVVK